MIAIIVFILPRVPLRDVWSDWDRFTPSRLISTDLIGGSSLTQFVYGEPFIATSAVVWTAMASTAFLIGSMVVCRRLES